MSILHGQAAKLMDGGFLGTGSLAFADEPAEALLARLRQLLARGIHGLSFGAYVEEQGPDQHTVLSVEQIRDRMAIIAPYTRWIRTFSCTDGNEHAPAVARSFGLKTLVGAWIGDNPAKNEEEIRRLIDVGRAGHVDLAAVGNEVLLRGEMPEEALIDAIRRVREALPNVPVATVDAYYLFAERPALVAACDYLPVNCYPFWEKCALDHSIAYLGEMVRRVRAVAGDRPIVIAETGWPTAGSPEGPAVPSVENAARYALNLIPWAEAEGVPLFWFAAFDEAWKVGREGDCGAYWGLWDAQGRPKFEP